MNAIIYGQYDVKTCVNISIKGFKIAVNRVSIVLVAVGIEQHFIFI